MAKKYANKFKDGDGVWRTIGGRRVFIKTGQNLSSAMEESGKFPKTKSGHIKREDVVKAKQELHNRELHKQTEDMLNAYGTNRYKAGQEYWYDRYKEASGYEREGKELLDSYYDKPKLSREDLSDLEGKHILGNKYRQLEKDYSDLSWKMQEDDYYYDYKDDVKLQKLRQDADTERTRLGIDTQEKYDNMINKNNMYYKGSKKDYKKLRNEFDESDLKVSSPYAKAELNTKADYIERHKQLELAKDRVNKQYEQDIADARMSGNDKLEESAKKARVEQLRDIDRLQKENIEKYQRYGKEEDVSPMSEWSDTTGTGFSDLQSTTLKTRYKGTYDYLKETTGLSEKQILEILKRMEKEK